jgi:hypothetical protein
VLPKISTMMPVPGVGKCWFMFLILVLSVVTSSAVVSSIQFPHSDKIVQFNSTGTAESENPFIDYVVDLEPFKRVIDTALKSSVGLNIKREACNIPDGAIMITIANHHIFSLIRTRHKIMANAGVLSCLEQRFVTVCLDKACMEMCEAENMKNCVRLTVPDTPEVGFGAASDFQMISYNYIVWLKYEALLASLQVANQVFYFDADVMVFGNPFPFVLWGRDAAGNRIPGEYDIMYQRERGVHEKGCGGSVNGGVIYLRNSTDLFEKWAPKILSHRAEMINLGGRSDQDIIGDYVSLLKYCTLPVKHFMGVCVSSQERGYDVNTVVTFHTNCVSGISTKLNRINAFANRRFSPQSNTAGPKKHYSKGKITKQHR